MPVPESSPMAKPSLPRLENLDPNDVAALVDEKLLAWVRAFPTHDVVIRTPSALGARAAELTRYAQSGAGLDHDAVSDAVSRLVEALYRRPIDDCAPWPSDDDGRDPFGDPNDALSCVLLAALARRALSRGTHRGRLINARWLAALASLAVSRVHQLRTRLRRVGTSIDARDAVRFLEERAVPGFVDPAIDRWRAEVEAFHARAGELGAAERERTRSALVSRFWALKGDKALRESAQLGLERLYRRFNRTAPPGANLRTLRPA